jgi:hypothetical protein
MWRVAAEKMPRLAKKARTCLLRACWCVGWAMLLIDDRLIKPISPFVIANQKMP